MRDTRTANAMKSRLKASRGVVPLTAIRRFAREIAEHFRPERIMFFGSYAYGTPQADSDVDLLVVMPSIKHRITGLLVGGCLLAAMTVLRESRPCD